MGYIHTTVDVEIDYDDISDDEVLDIIEDRVKDYTRSIARGGVNEENKKKQLDDFVKGVRDSVSGVNVDVIESSEGRTLEDDLYYRVFKILKENFTLDEVETFAKTKCKYL
jgi:hypothetical protein